MNKVFLNNKIVDSDKACISPADCGFLYGMGIFETMRADNGKVFALDDHLDRLLNSTTTLEVEHVFDKAYLTEAVKETLDANKLENARIRLTLTAGPTPNSPDDNAEPTLLITASPFAPYPQEYYDNGVTVTLSDIRQSVTDPTSFHKTTNFFPRLIALNAAHKRQAVESLWFTDDGRLAEGCVSNVFLVKDSVLYTPKADTPIMPGIARKHILGLAKSEGIKAEEKDLDINDLLTANEVFLSNVIMTAMPVTAIEAHEVADSKPGEITKILMNKFNGLL